MSNNIEPPQVQLCEVARAQGWMDRQSRTHIWVAIEGNKVTLHRTDPQDSAAMHTGIWAPFVDAAVFVAAINAAAERLWRAAP